MNAKLQYLHGTMWVNSALTLPKFSSLEEQNNWLASLEQKPALKYRVHTEAVAPTAPTAPSTPASLAKQPHYAAYQPEPITVIEGWKLNYNMGNAIKYISRAGKKDATVEGHTKDLEKAINYIRREINTLRGEPGWE